MASRNGSTALRKRGSITQGADVEQATENAPSASASNNTKNKNKPLPTTRQSDSSTNTTASTWRVFLPLLFIVLVVKALLTSSRASRNHQSLSAPFITQQKQQKRARFPKYGTPEFEEKCNWTLPPSNTKDATCALLVRPPLNTHEGVADWTSQITRAYMQARQVDCKVIFDYGLHVDISRVLTPFEDASYHNWTIPSDVTCNDSCQHSVSYRVGNWTGRRAYKKVPYYRHVFTYTHDWLYKGDYDYMGSSETLPGFQLETGMACALGNLLNLSPHASQFQPNLYTELLPKLHDSRALVIALYMRTNRADVMATNEARHESIVEEVRGKYNETATHFANIATCIEQKYLSISSNANNNVQEEYNVDIERVYWVVLSDSPEAKRTVRENYSGTNANEQVPLDERKYKNRSIPREVLATSARGIHTRAERNVSTAEFAEAFLDWYLIGESDAVVTDMSSSFGPTGALRTARPLYRGGKCETLTLLHDASERTKKAESSSVRKGMRAKVKKGATAKKGA